MRIFIAIELPYDIKEKVEQVEILLKKCDVHAKWVNPKNLHFTLKFLGEATQEQIKEIEKIIEDVANRFRPFTVNLKEFGFFPNEKRPRVFFVSTDNEEILRKISQRLEEKLEKIGFKKEDRFKSHITVARLRSNKNLHLLKKEIKNISLTEAIPIKEITLFKSTLTESGPIYETICKMNLTA